MIDIESKDKKEVGEEESEERLKKMIRSHRGMIKKKKGMTAREREGQVPPRLCYAKFSAPFSYTPY